MGFEDLEKKYLIQEVLSIGNNSERWKIWQALILLDYEGSSERLDNIPGIELLDFPDRQMDCMQYATGHKDISILIDGILDHDGHPKAGDIIIYGYGIKHPVHVGIWHEDGLVISKWGERGPLMKHRWNQVLPDHGKNVYFSTYKRASSIDWFS